MYKIIDSLQRKLSENNIFFCIPAADDCGTIQEKQDDLRTKIPWTAGIFARANTKQPFKYLITGTVLSPNVVLTIFAGAYGEPSKKGGKYFISPPSNHLIAVGLRSNNLQDVDQNTQLAEVSPYLYFTSELYFIKFPYFYPVYIIFRQN